jgi:hypothetical protein
MKRASTTRARQRLLVEDRLVPAKEREERPMHTRIKTLRTATFAIACAVWMTAAAWAAAPHRDGPATTYRGWGPSVVTADGYICTIFDSLGVRVGEVQFHADGRIDLTLGTEQAHYALTAPAGITTFHDLDTTTFPSIPKKFRARDGYHLMIFTGRFSVGENMMVDAPITALARSISVVEARCVYVVDSAGNVVFCLNCTFTVS